MSLLITALFLLLVPSLLHTAPWDFWGNTNISPQAMLMFVGALFSAVLAIAIFKEYADDGTELIIVSKPINRTKIIVTKFVMFIFFSMAFALSSILIALATFAFQQGKDNPNLVGSLILSVFVANFMFTIVFGFFAIVISLFLNKVWTILLNVIVITLLTIYATVTTVTVKTPGELANKHSSYVSTIKYLTNQGTIQLGAALSPIDVDNESNPLAFNDNKGQSEFWHQYMNESTANTATAFNVVGQFTQMNNLLGLGQYQADNSCAYFDNSRMFSYDFNNELSRKEPSCVPLFVPENDLGIDAVKYDNTNIGDIAVASMQHLIELEANQKIGVLGTSHDSTESEFTKMFDLNQYDFGVGYTNKQWAGSKPQYYSANQIEEMMTNADEEMFNRILTFFEDENIASLFLNLPPTSKDDFYARIYAGFKIKLNIDQTGWGKVKDVETGTGCTAKPLYVDEKNGKRAIERDIQSLVDGTPGKPVQNIYDFLHLIIVDNQESLYPDATDADKQISLMETMLKFKYHLFKTICSQLQFGGGPLSGIEPSDDLQCALNTPIDIDEEIGGQQFKFQTNTSPILPLGHRSATDAEHPMSYLQDPSDISIDYKPDPDYQPDVITLKLDKVMWNTKELMDLINEKISIKTGGQSPYDGLSFGKDNDWRNGLDWLLPLNTLTNIACIDKTAVTEDKTVDASVSPWGEPFQIKINTPAHPWASAFYAYPQEANGPNDHEYTVGQRIMMDRALARLVTDDNYFGYEDGEDPWGFDRNHRFTANLCANTEMNYPLMYQSLMSPFTVKPVMNNGLIILGWVCCAIILGSVGATIFIRKDFT